MPPCAKQKQHARKSSLTNHNRLQYDEFGEKFVLCRGRARNYTCLRLTLNQLSTLEGFTTQQAANYFGIATTTFKTCLRSLGIKFWCQGRWRHSPEWKEQSLAEASKAASCLAAPALHSVDFAETHMKQLSGDITKLPNLMDEAAFSNDSLHLPIFCEPKLVQDSMDAWALWYSNTEASETEQTGCTSDFDDALCASDDDLSFLRITEPSIDAAAVLKNANAP
jgi:hypothetical protein